MLLKPWAVLGPYVIGLLLVWHTTYPFLLQPFFSFHILGGNSHEIHTFFSLSFQFVLLIPLFQTSNYQNEVLSVYTYFLGDLIMSPGFKHHLPVDES